MEQANDYSVLLVSYTYFLHILQYINIIYFKQPMCARVKTRFDSTAIFIYAIIHSRFVKATREYSIIYIYIYLGRCLSIFTLHTARSL